MTPEEKAQISRENGAKSRGPRTDAGKAKSSRNAIKHGDYADVLKHFVPPHEAVHCNEDKLQYQGFVDELVETYRPQNPPARDLVRDMAIARWQIERLNHSLTACWNMAFIHANKQPTNVVPELRDTEVNAEAIAAMLSGNSMLSKINREIARLQQVLARAERRLRLLKADCPNQVPAAVPKNDEAPQNAEAEQTEPLNAQPCPEMDGNEPAVYTTECTEAVIQGYRREFPHHRIVFVPPSEEENSRRPRKEYADLPRRVA
jgi:hypothetical protein